VAWLDHVEDDGQRKSAAGYWRKLPQAKKKLSENAATNGDTRASVLRNDVAWPDNVENDG